MPELDGATAAGARGRKVDVLTWEPTEERAAPPERAAEPADEVPPADEPLTAERREQLETKP